jgi:hypothetical protein
MKHLLFLLILFSGCSRDSTTGRVQGDPEISFDIDGKHYEFKGAQTVANGGVGVFANKATGIPGGIKTVYTFSGFLNNQNMAAIYIGIDPPDTLKTIMYQVKTLTIRAHDVVYAVMNSTNSNDNVSIKISDYRNGVVNASFSGMVTKIISITPAVTQTSTITNGKIQNVSINY